MKNLKVLALAFVAALVGTSNAIAAVPAGVEAVFTTTATDFGTVAGYGWVLLLVIVGGLVMFKIVKKVLGKAS